MLEAPDPQDPLLPTPPFQPIEPPPGRWTSFDLVIFGLFFACTVVFLPLGMLYVMRMFRPGLQLTDLSAVEQVVIQGIMDLVLVGFIMLLVKVLHGRSFRETIRWYPNQLFSPGYLVSVGAALAITVMIASSFFPPSSTPPIEKLLTSTRSLYVFAIFGIGLAPLFEEVIFRGFLFQVFQDLYSPVTAIPITAGLFALMHVPQLWGSWAAIALIFFVGYALAFLRERSGSLIPSLIVHISYNSMLFAVTALSTFFQKTAGK
jgi:membrane protease YdiL (CAAX protease family)